MAIQSPFIPVINQSKQTINPVINPFSLKGTIGKPTLLTANSTPISTPALPNSQNMSSIQSPMKVGASSAIPKTNMTPANMSYAAPADMKKSNYQGSSIVEYLNSLGQASDYGTRSSLASKYGIQNYVGSAAQNTQLLNILRGSQSSSNPVIPTVQYNTPAGPTNSKGDIINPDTGSITPASIPATPVVPEVSAYDMVKRVI